ncbi:hypothetical protein EV426DRAFT_594786 [Tirmania nivea]|nr:hypothetical protein EV426DRAFT_594786 [Tirmania nivea]
MKGTSILASFALLTGSAVAQSGAWGQCGGIGRSGATTSVSGYYCKVTNICLFTCFPCSQLQPILTYVLSSDYSQTTQITLQASSLPNTFNPGHTI